MGDEASGQHVLYHYCSHADARSLDTRQVFGSLLKQLIFNGILSSVAQQELLTFVGENEDDDHEERLAKILKSAILSHPVAFLVVDGLDVSSYMPRRKSDSECYPSLAEYIFK